MSSRMDEVRQRLANGESFTDISWGKGWQERLPQLARVASFCGVSSFSNDETNERGFGASVRSGNAFQNIITEVLEFRVSGVDKEEALRQFDEACRTFLEEGGEAHLHRLKLNNWQETLPHLAFWMGQGKRYCVEVEICLDSSARVKAWFYNKPQNREEVLVEEKFPATQDEALQLLDVRVGQWLQLNPLPTVPSEDEAAHLPF